MLDNTLVLPVDVANNGTWINKTFTRYTEFQNRSSYIGEAHSVSMRDNLSFYRSFPTKAANFKGTSKTSLKLTKDIEVVGNDGLAQLTAPIIAEVNFSFPVGTTSAEMVEVRQKLIALLDNDSLMTKLNYQLEV